jgi:hypothetical protein
MSSVYQELGPQAGLQPQAGHRSDLVVVDKTVIQLDDEHHWL